MLDILTGQISQYEEALREFSRAEPKTLQEIEEAIAVGVSLYRTVRAEVQFFNSQRHDSHEQMLVAAREYHRSYERISTQLDLLYGLVEPMHERGIPIRGIEKLTSARLELRSILRLSPDRLEESYQSMRAGRLIPLAKVRDELQRRLHT